MCLTVRETYNDVRALSRVRRRSLGRVRTATTQKRQQVHWPHRSFNLRWHPEAGEPQAADTATLTHRNYSPKR